MRIIIYEDDLDFALYFENLIDSIIKKQRLYKTVEVAVNTNSNNRIMEYILAQTEDMLFFLDICIDGMPYGIDLAKRIKQLSADHTIAFITNYPDKIAFDSASKLNSLNHIVKYSPLFEAEISLTITKAIEIHKKSNILVIKNHFCELNPIRLDSIYFIEHVKNSSNICIWHNNGSIESVNTLRNVIGELDDRFYLINRSTIINMDMILRIKTGKREVTLNNRKILRYSLFTGKGFLKAYYEHINVTP